MKSNNNRLNLSREDFDNKDKPFETYLKAMKNNEVENLPEVNEENNTLLTSSLSFNQTNDIAIDIVEENNNTTTLESKSLSTNKDIKNIGTKYNFSKKAQEEEEALIAEIKEMYKEFGDKGDYNNNKKDNTLLKLSFANSQTKYITTDMVEENNNTTVENDSYSLFSKGLVPISYVPPSFLKDINSKDVITIEGKPYYKLYTLPPYTLQSSPNEIIKHEGSINILTKNYKEHRKEYNGFFVKKPGIPNDVVKNHHLDSHVTYLFDVIGMSQYEGDLVTILAEGCILPKDSGGRTELPNYNPYNDAQYMPTIPFKVTDDSYPTFINVFVKYIDILLHSKNDETIYKLDNNNISFKDFNHLNTSACLQ